MYKYRLGYYDENGDLECVATATSKQEAKQKYDSVHERYGCTVWIQKIEFLAPKDLE